VPFVVTVAMNHRADNMQKHPDDLNDDDKITHRKWTIAFCFFYSFVFIGLISLAVMNVPNDQVAMRDGGNINITGSLKISAK
jgi:hypothetical protein